MFAQAIKIAPHDPVGLTSQLWVAGRPVDHQLEQSRPTQSKVNPRVPSLAQSNLGWGTRALLNLWGRNTRTGNEGIASHRSSHRKFPWRCDSKTCLAGARSAAFGLAGDSGRILRKPCKRAAAAGFGRGSCLGSRRRRILGVDRSCAGQVGHYRICQDEFTRPQGEEVERPRACA